MCCSYGTYSGSIKVKFSRYRSGVAHRVGRGIALLFHDRGTRRGWVVSSTFRPHFTPGKDPVPILQEAGWVPGPVWTGGKSRPHRDSILDRPARIQSLHRLSYPAHYSGSIIFTKSNARPRIQSARDSNPHMIFFSPLKLWKWCGLDSRIYGNLFIWKWIWNWMRLASEM